MDWHRNFTIWKVRCPGVPARKAKTQTFFIPFTQPRGAVMQVKHGKGKSANVRDEAKPFLMMEWWMVKSGAYPGTIAELAAHYEVAPNFFTRLQKHLKAERTLTSNRKNCGTKRKFDDGRWRKVNRKWKRRASQKTMSEDPQTHHA